MKKKLVIFLLLTMYLSDTIVVGQTWFNYNQFNSGLDSNSVWEVTDDIFHNIWVGLGTGSLQGDGLDKFDGVNWTHYDISNSGLPQNQVRAIKGDVNGNIWLHYWGGAGITPGLTKFDGTNWIIYDSTYSPLLQNQTIDIQMDKDNNLWISCIGGLVKYDGITFTNYFHNHWGLLAIQDSANIWRGANLGLDHFNPITGVWTHYDMTNSNIPSNSVRALAIDTTGLLWISFDWNFNGGLGNGGGNGGVATFDGITFTAIWPFQNPYTYGSDIIVDENNTVWLATLGEGLYKFDGITWTNISGLPNGYFTNLLADYQNNIWVADLNSGIWTNSTPVGLPNFENNTQNLLYPNPANEYIAITLSNNGDLKVLNTLGQIVLTKTITPDHLETVILDISKLSPGIYYIDSGIEMRKFLKL
jgi:hypothetical protein